MAAEQVSQQAILAHHQSAVQHEGGLNHQQLPHHSKQSGNQHCPKVSDQAAAVAAADGLTEQASIMIAKMQELAESANVAASAAKEAVEQLAEIKKQSNGSFRSAASDAGNGATQEQPAVPLRLTEEALREHTRSQRAASPQVPLLPGLEAAAAAKAGGPAPGGIGRGPQHAVGAWSLLQPVEAGDTILQFDAYDGLAVGDILEIDFSSPQAEFITVARFGSVVASAPLRFQHGAGSEVRRVIEGNGQRFTPLPSEVGATPSHQPKSSLRDAEGCVDHQSWSPREREHQLSRYKRKA